MCNEVTAMSSSRLVHAIKVGNKNPFSATITMSDGNEDIVGFLITI